MFVTLVFVLSVLNSLSFGSTSYTYLQISLISRLWTALHHLPHLCQLRFSSIIQSHNLKHIVSHSLQSLLFLLFNNKKEMKRKRINKNKIADWLSGVMIGVTMVTQTRHQLPKRWRCGVPVVSQAPPQHLLLPPMSHTP